MAAKEESPLISVYEFCYAAGIGCRILQLPREETEQLLAAETFPDFKTQIQNRMRGEEEAFLKAEHGKRLYRLIVSCRHKGQMDEDARSLFADGYSEPM